MANTSRHSVILRARDAVAQVLTPHLGAADARERANNFATPHAMPLPAGVTSLDVARDVYRAYPEAVAVLARDAWDIAVREASQ